MQITKTFIPFLVVLIALIMGLYFTDQYVESISDADTIVVISPSSKHTKENLLQFSFEREQEMDSSHHCFSTYGAHVKNKAWDKAVSSLQDCITDTVVLNKAIGKMYFKAKDYSMAQEYFNRVVQTGIKDYATYNYLGIINSRLHLYLKAESCYQKAITIKPNSSISYLNLGIFYYHKKYWDQAQLTLTKAVALSSGKEKAKALTYLGIVNQNLENKHEAITQFNEAINLSPKYLFPRINLALAQDEISDKLKEIDKVIALAPDYGLAYFYKGLIYAEKDQIENALSFIEKATFLNTDDEEMIAALEKFYVDVELLEKAKELVNGLANQGRKGPGYYFSKAKIHAHEEQRDSAVYYYRKVIELTGDEYPEAYLNLGLTFKKSGDFDQAITYYSKAISLKKNYDKAYYNRAITYKEIDEIELAIQDYETIIKHDQSNAKVWYNLGLLYNSIEHYPKSIHCFQHAIKYDASNYKPYYNLGRTYSRWKKNEQAEKAYMSLLELFPKHANGWHNLGVVRKELKKYNLALQAYEKCLALEPNNSSIWNNMGIVASLQGRYDQAIDYFNQSITIDFNNHETRFNLANQYIKKGALKKATPQLKKAIALKPSYQKAYDYLFECYDELGWQSNKKAVLKEKVKHAPKAKDHYALGRFYHKERNLSKAIDQYKKAMTMDQTNEWVYYWAGKLYEESNDLTKAQDYYQKTIALDPLHKFSHYHLYLLGIKDSTIDQAYHKNLLISEYPTFCSEKNIL